MELEKDKREQLVEDVNTIINFFHRDGWDGHGAQKETVLAFEEGSLKEAKERIFKILGEEETYNGKEIEKIFEEIKKETAMTFSGEVSGMGRLQNFLNQKILD